ncbi:6-pyruvoyl trahydropterin synthase family protein [Marinimicrobium agarilyticum]|uniref:6-pyruvoyl trahydropterin synthase family protein n=1 Tax=Marinimicrobium agarilyticum TaxID=306546 RepID=UPI0003FBB75B|nr:6-carboxytetrahydropterin synthase [Marinimicrobium agarilyticum]
MLLFVDNLATVDFSFLDPRRGLLGETWLADVKLAGDLDEQGMVCDFSTVKKALKTWLDKEIDHRLLVPSQSPQLTMEEKGDQITLHWRFGDREEYVDLTCPRQAIALVDTDELTRESVAKWCVSQLEKESLFPAGTKLDLSFTTESIEGVFYHYSHGLKKHEGNCQRIAHGHRSTISIWADDIPSPALEGEWASRLRDIYLGTTEDLVSEKDDYYRFAYSAPQGDFDITLPQRCCYLMETDTTVELIADHIAKVTKSEYPTSTIRVKAFEGMNKGAIAEA